MAASRDLHPAGPDRLSGRQAVSVGGSGRIAAERGNLDVAAVVSTRDNADQIATLLQKRASTVPG
jgi:hypothetical protein